MEFQLQHQSFQRIFGTDFLQDGLVGSPCSPTDCQESSPTPQFKSIDSSLLSFLYSPTLTSIHDHWENQSLESAIHIHISPPFWASFPLRSLDSIFKSRDITLPTKVRLVKAMVFPVVMYGCESWTVKKAECRRIDAFEEWCWRRLLRVPWTARRSNQSILNEIILNIHWKD